MLRPLRCPLSSTSPTPQPGDNLLAVLVFLSSRCIEVAEILRPQKGDPKILEPPFLQTLSLEGQRVYVTLPTLHLSGTPIATLFVGF